MYVMFFSVDFLFKKCKAFDLGLPKIPCKVTPDTALVTQDHELHSVFHGVQLVTYSCLHLSTQCLSKHLLSTHHFLSAALNTGIVLRKISSSIT